MPLRGGHGLFLEFSSGYPRFWREGDSPEGGTKWGGNGGERGGTGERGAGSRPISLVVHVVTHGAGLRISCCK